MTASSQRVLELKAAALLWGSPLAALDPEGESARRQKIEAWLAEQGISLNHKESALIEGCYHEAQDAALGTDQLETQPPPFSPAHSPPALRHPLSAEEIAPSSALKSAWHSPLGFLEELPPRGGREVTSWYRQLWRALMRHPLFRELPADAALRDHTVAAHRSMTAALVGARLGGGQPAFLALHVGPVQSFIEAARRTSDLALGSYTVGYLAFAGAIALAKELGPDVLLNPDVSYRTLADKLLFEEDIAPNDKPKLLRAALMNRALAVVPEPEADRLAALMAGAVSVAWQEMGESALRACDDAWRRSFSSNAPFDRKAFLAQLERHLEIDLVALPWPKDRDELRSLLTHAGAEPPAWLSANGPIQAGPSAAFGLLADLTERMLAAHRSALQPLGATGDQRPKCTNCGRYEQLGRLSERPSEQQRDSRRFFEDMSEALQQRKASDQDVQRTSLQLTRGEGLCAVCLTKRLSAEAHFGDRSTLGLSWRDGKDRVLLRFPSTATFASAPFRWVLANPAAPSPMFDAACKHWTDCVMTLQEEDKLDFTPPGNLLEGLGELGHESDLLAQEGTWLYDLSYVPLSAWRSHFAKDPAAGKLEVLSTPLQAAKDALGELRELTGASASEYYAVIVLDGDNMGDWKAGRHSRSPTYQDLGFNLGRQDGKRPVHPALYTEISRRLALLNDDLHNTVAKHLGRLVYHGGDDVLAIVPLATVLPCLEEIRTTICSSEHLGGKVTVSAGVSITHWKPPLSHALSEARGAEKSAKDAGKDGFGISLNPRSGEQLSFTLPWRYGNEDRTIPLIRELLRSNKDKDKGEESKIASGKAAYVLRDELPALATCELREAFLHRAVQLLFPPPRKRKDPGSQNTTAQDEKRRQVKALFDRVLGTCPTPEGMEPERDRENLRRRMNAVSNLLLFLRFLSRQENGIDSEKLLDSPHGRAAAQEGS